MVEQPYKNLLVWEKADKHLRLVYFVTASFPREELFGVVSQWRRAALSVVLNIVEGRARAGLDGSREYLRFLIIARASLAECSYLLEFSKSMKYINEKQFKEIEYKMSNVSFFLNQTMDTVSKNMEKGRKKE